MAKGKHCDCRCKCEMVSKEKAQKEFEVDSLGRKRPECFSSTLVEVIFVVSMLLCLSMADFFIGGFQAALSGLVEVLDIPDESRTWPASVVTLMAGAFLLPFGRLADMYGGYIVFHGGMIWFIIWSIITGFSSNFLMLVCCRAMVGIGAAAFLPAGMSMLGRIYVPGPRKNVVFCLYGALSPGFFFIGMIMGGMSRELFAWGWYFWIGAILTIITTGGSMLTAPRDYAEARARGVGMDWWGLCTTVPGIISIVFAITESRQLGWTAPGITMPLCIGFSFLIAAFYIEGWVAKEPLLPPSLFKVKFMKRILSAMSLLWGVYGIYLFYSNFYINAVLKQSPIMAAVWFAPWALGCLTLSVLGGLVLHLIPGRILLIIAGVCKILAPLFFALMPENPSYWAWVFPAMLCEAICIVMLWSVGNVYFTSSLPAHQQGLAGALIYITIFIAGAFFLSIVSVALGKFEAAGMDVRMQYKGAFWIGVGLGVAALAICCFINLGTASSDEDTPKGKLSMDASGSDTEAEPGTFLDLHSDDEPMVRVRFQELKD